MAAVTPPSDPDDIYTLNLIQPRPAIQFASLYAYPTPDTTPNPPAKSTFINKSQYNFDFSSLRIALPNAHRRVPIPIPFCEFPSPCIENHPFFNIENLNDYRKGNEFWESWRIAWWKWHGHGDEKDSEILSDDDEEPLYKKDDPLFEFGYTKGEPKEVSLQRIRHNARIQRELDAKIEARRVRNHAKRLKYQFGLKHRKSMSSKMSNVLWLPKKAGEEGIIEWDMEDPQVANPLWNESDALNLDPLLEPAHMLQYSVIDQGSLHPRNVWNGVHGAVHTFPISEDRALGEERMGHDSSNVTRKSFPVDIRRIRNRASLKTQDPYATEDNYRNLDNQGLFSDADVVDRYDVAQFPDLSQDWLEEWRRDRNYTGSQMPNEQEITLAESRGERPRRYQFDAVYRAGRVKNAWHTPFEATSILHREQMEEEEFKANETHEHEFWMDWLDETEENAEAYFLINLDPRTVVINDLLVKQNQIAGPLPQFAVIEIEGQIGFWFGKNGLNYAPPLGGREDPVPFKGKYDVHMLNPDRFLKDDKMDENANIDSLTGLKRVRAPDMPRKRVYKKYTDDYVGKPVDSDTSKRARSDTYKEPDASALEGNGASENLRVVEEKERERLMALRDQCQLRGLRPFGNFKALQERIDKYDRGEGQADTAAGSGEDSSPSPNLSDKELEMRELREQCKERDIKPFGSADDMRASLRNYEGAKVILPGLTLEESIKKRKERIASIDVDLSKHEKLLEGARDVLLHPRSSRHHLSVARDQLTSSKKEIGKLKDKRKTHQAALDLIATFSTTSEPDVEVRLSRKQTMLKLSRELIVRRNVDLATGDKVRIPTYEDWHNKLIAILDEDVRLRIDVELKLWQVDGIKHMRDGNVDEEFSDKAALEDLLKAEQENMSALADPQKPKLDDSESSALLRYREQRKTEQSISEKLEAARSRDPTFPVKEERSELVRELRLTRERHESFNLLYATPPSLRQQQLELFHLDAQWDATWDYSTEFEMVNLRRVRFLHRHPKFRVRREIPLEQSSSGPEEVSVVPQKLPTLLTRDLIKIWRDQMDEFYQVRKDLRRANQLVRTAGEADRPEHLEAVKICEEKIKVIKQVVTEHHKATAYAATNQLVDQMEIERHMRDRIMLFEIEKETGNPVVDEAGRPLLDLEGRPLDGSLGEAISELQNVVDEHDLSNYNEALKDGAEEPLKAADEPRGPPSPLPPDELTGNPIIDFYNGGKDPIGQQTLHDILNYSRNQLETIHNYIQIAFPITESSKYMKNAPLLDEQAFEAFRTDRNLVRRMRRMFCHMLEFYGFSMAQPRKTNNGWRREIFEDKFPGVEFNWLRPRDHNHKRITRIIRCLRLVGMEDDAQEFLQALERRCSKLPAGQRPSDRSLTFWRNAAAWPLYLIPSTTALNEASDYSQPFLVNFEKKKREYVETEETRRDNNLIVRLFTGGTDANDRSLNNIASMSDYELAVTDDIWPLICPLPEKSPVDEQAHQIDRTSFEAFHINYKGMQDQLKKMLVRILRHWGMNIQWTMTDYYHTVVEISKSGNYSTQSLLWLDSDKRNGQLRVKNVIRSLRIAGLEAEAQELYNFVRQAAVVMPPGKRPVNEQFRQWAYAISRPLNIPPSMRDEDITDETGPDFLREYERKKADEAALLAKFPPNMPHPAVIGPGSQPKTGAPPPLETSPGGTPVGAENDVADVEPTMLTGQGRGRPRGRPRGSTRGRPRGRPRGQRRGVTAREGKADGVGQVGFEKLNDPFGPNSDTSNTMKVRFSSPLVIPASGPPTGTTGSRPTQPIKTIKRLTTAQVVGAETPKTPQNGTGKRVTRSDSKTAKTTPMKGGAKGKSTEAQAAEAAKNAELAARQAELDKTRDSDQSTREFHIVNETNRMNSELRGFNWRGPLVPPDPNYKKVTARGGRGYICADYVKNGHPHIMDMRDPLNYNSWPQLYGDGNWNGELGKLLSLSDLGLDPKKEKQLRKWQQI